MCAWILSTHDLCKYILGEVHMYKFWWFLEEESTHLTSRYSNLVAVCMQWLCNVSYTRSSKWCLSLYVSSTCWTVYSTVTSMLSCLYNSLYYSINVWVYFDDEKTLWTNFIPKKRWVICWRLHTTNYMPYGRIIVTQILCNTPTWLQLTSWVGSL